MRRFEFGDRTMRGPTARLVTARRLIATFARRPFPLLGVLAFAACSETTPPRLADRGEGLVPLESQAGPALVPTSGPTAPLVPARVNDGSIRIERTPMSSTDLIPSSSARSSALATSAAVAAPASGLVWQNTATGQRVIWQMSGSSYTGDQTSYSVGPTWKIAASADFTGNGSPDLVWQNSATGERVIWSMNGSTYTGTQTSFSVGTDWDIAAAADFTGDGKADLVWQNRVTGQRVIWQMNGTTYSGTQTGFSVGTDWDIVAAADFTRDGKPDLVWQNHVTGQRVIWQMNRTTYSGVQTGFSVGPVWNIVVAADFTGDTQPDLLWQNTATGQRIIWQMNGPTYSGSQTSFSVGPVWDIAAIVGPQTVATTPPPPAGTLLFSETFENANLASRGWYDGTSVQLSTAEHIPGSASSVQFKFNSGASVPTTGYGPRHKFTPTTSLYVSYHVKYSNGWVGSNETYHPHEIYVLSDLDDDWSALANNWMTLYIEQNHVAGQGSRPVLSMQDNKSVNTSRGTPTNNLVGVTEDRSTGGCNGTGDNLAGGCYNDSGLWYNAKTATGPITFKDAPGAGYISDWNFVETYFQMNTIVNGVGQADGIMQYWFNGQLVIDEHHVMFRAGARSTIKWGQLILSPYIGDGSPINQTVYYDDLRIATARIP